LNLEAVTRPDSAIYKEFIYLEFVWLIFLEYWCDAVSG